MSEATTELKKELQRTLDALQTLRDEVRVKLHLAGKDLKQQWDEFEPHLEDVQKAAHEVSEASRVALAQAVKKLEKFRASLR